MSAHGIVFLTDGLERLDLPGMNVEFHLNEDWEVVGEPCAWVWPHEQPGTIAGAEVVTAKGTATFDYLAPIVIHEGERIVAATRLTLEALVAA